MSSNVLYRKYRPLIFADVHGQTHVKSVLVQSVLEDSFSHGYLFAGPRGTGKTSMARIFAKAINSESFKDNKDVSHDDKHFESITNGDNVDIIELDAASNRGIEDIRELKENVNFLPAVLDYKVYIIDEAHMLTKEAFNALLKTLEEPPKHVVFILATTEPHKIPVTIHSRVVRFDFNLADKEELGLKLKKIASTEKIDITEDAIDLIHRISEGSFRDSESILAKLASNGSKIDADLVYEVLGIPTEAMVQNLIDLLTYKTEDIPAFIRELEKKNISISILLEDTVDHILYRANYSNKKELVSFVVDTLEHLSAFKNPYSFLHAKIVTFTESDTEPVKSNKKVTHVTSNKPEIKKEEPVSKAKEEKPDPRPSGNESELFKLVEDEDMRLSVILEASKVELDGSTLTISNEFNFNLNYVEKNTAIIIKVLDEKLSISNAKVVTKKVEESVAPSVPKSSETPKEEEQDIEEENNKEQSGESDVDNSELVESLL